MVKKNIAELQEELIELMDIASIFSGIHKKIGDKKIYTAKHLVNIREGRVNLPESSIGKTQDLISLYKKEINKKINEIKVKW